MLSLRGFVNDQPKPCYNAGMRRNNAQEWASAILFLSGFGVLVGLHHWSGLVMMLAGSLMFSWGNPHVHPGDL